jgi:ornithine carbamoyltransferase
MVFQKPSLRTRVSFEVGMKHLGGDALYLSPDEIGLGKRESIADVARVLSGYVQGIMARVFAHDHVLELAKWASVPVINGLSDYNHPCQGLGDIMTVYEHFGRVEGLKVAFIGDGNNVATSLLMASALLGANFSIASPPGYELKASTLVKARPLAEDSHITIETFEDPDRSRGRRGRGLHRYLDQHGPGGRSRGTPQALPEIPGQHRSSSPRRARARSSCTACPPIAGKS